MKQVSDFGYPIQLVEVATPPTNSPEIVFQPIPQPVFVRPNFANWRTKIADKLSSLPTKNHHKFNVLNLPNRLKKLSLIAP